MAIDSASGAWPLSHPLGVVNARVELVGAGELDDTGSRTWLQRFLTDKLRIW